jgi:hypothetical protein
MNAKGLIILLTTVTVITALVLVWYNNQITLEAPRNFNVSHVEKQPQSLGATIYDVGTNPVGENLPDTNPMTDAVVNPFDAYTNPFE